MFVSQATSGRDPETIRREGAITPIEDASKYRRDGKKIGRPRPPNASHCVAIDISSANLPAISKEQAQIAQQFRFAQRKFLANPAGLKRCDVESAQAQRLFPKWDPSPAESAGIVVKNPAERLFVVVC
jgi:hypothetical protein